jgi:hypothetical protein
MSARWVALDYCYVWQVMDAARREAHARFIRTAQVSVFSQHMLCVARSISPGGLLSAGPKCYGDAEGSAGTAPGC